MPVRKRATAKKAAPAKKTAIRSTAKKQVAKGDGYVCEVCGLAITVDEACDCIGACDILCCGKPMKPRRARARAKTAAK
ncbi:MAG: hypothetical protein V1894_07115 [Chloroflexota bacterium]